MWMKEGLTCTSVLCKPFYCAFLSSFTALWYNQSKKKNALEQNELQKVKAWNNNMVDCFATKYMKSKLKERAR